MVNSRAACEGKWLMPLTGVFVWGQHCVSGLSRAPVRPFPRLYAGGWLTCRSHVRCLSDGKANSNRVLRTVQLSSHFKINSIKCQQCQRRCRRHGPEKRPHWHTKPRGAAGVRIPWRSIQDTPLSQHPSNPVFCVFSLFGQQGLLVILSSSLSLALLPQCVYIPSVFSMVPEPPHSSGGWALPLCLWVKGWIRDSFTDY